MDASHAPVPEPDKSPQEPRVLKDRAEAFENLLGQFREFGAAVVDHRLVDGPQNAVGNVGRTRDLEKVATGVNHNRSIGRSATGRSFAMEFTSDVDRRKQQHEAAGIAYSHVWFA